MTGSKQDYIKYRINYGSLVTALNFCIGKYYYL